MEQRPLALEVVIVFALVFAAIGIIIVMTPAMFVQHKVAHARGKPSFMDEVAELESQYG